MSDVKKPKRVVLVGNPNIGKTSVFNKLCGLNQKTGNYPGVTVDKKVGHFTFEDHQIEIIDLPGINSIVPSSKDEELVSDYLLNETTSAEIDLVVLVCSALNLKRSLYLCDQILDLDLKCLLVINMSDLATKRGINIDAAKIKAHYKIDVVEISAKTNQGIDSLKKALIQENELIKPELNFIEESNLSILNSFAQQFEFKNLYKAFLYLLKKQNLLQEDGVDKLNSFVETNHINLRQWKVNESILRYKKINELVANSVHEDKTKATDFTTKADKILLHPFFGYDIFILIMFAIFQAVFWLASYPMDWIDSGMSAFGAFVESAMSEGYLRDLICQGIIPGIGGVVIFIPQIAILFLLFALLEESGYMSRIIFLMDKIMQRFGMSGKSIVPLISGFACAVPAIMSARSIENKKERLITILVTPLLTCSARIPVYVVLIALVVPNETYGIFNLQGLALMVMYLLGVFMALMAAFVFKKILKNDYKSYLIMEMPQYLLPTMRNVFIYVWQHVKSFIWGAGKIIVAASIILFVLATNGGNNFNQAEQYVYENYQSISQDEKDNLIESRKLQTSYLGMIGSLIEPAIKPLGYDWKIGIAIVSSLAAREVFVGTMSTIYSIGSDDEMKIVDRLRNEKNASSGVETFNLATTLSLLIFYAFALQCFSTIAITFKETQSYKWTIIQFVYMSALAYFAAMFVYQILST